MFLLILKLLYATCYGVGITKTIHTHTHRYTRQLTVLRDNLVITQDAREARNSLFLFNGHRYDYFLCAFVFKLLMISLIIVQKRRWINDQDRKSTLGGSVAGAFSAYLQNVIFGTPSTRQTTFVVE